MSEADMDVIINGKSTLYQMSDEEAKYKFMKSLESGVWYINNLNNGYVATVIADRIADMPAVMTKASFELRKQNVAKEVAKVLKLCQQREVMPTTRDIMSAINKGL